MLSLAQGKKLVKLARKSIESFFEGKKLEYEKEKKEFDKPKGVFVTILEWPSKRLRGCIGFPKPIKPLADAVVEASKAAAFADPRFIPLKKEELSSVIFEVSVLTEPKLIEAKPQELLKEIEIGKDGLIVELAGFSGLLLPQVAVEYGLNSLEFLRATCIKAGLPAEAWINPKCKVYKFQAQVFSETKPKGNVIEKTEARKERKSKGKRSEKGKGKKARKKVKK